jgi:hypothetical protein
VYEKKRGRKIKKEREREKERERKKERERESYRRLCELSSREQHFLLSFIVVTGAVPLRRRARIECQEGMEVPPTSVDAHSIHP